MLILTLKRLHEELLALDALVQEHGRALYDAVALEEWLDIIGVLSNLSARSGAISKMCLDIHFQVRLDRHGRSYSRRPVSAIRGTSLAGAAGGGIEYTACDHVTMKLEYSMVAAATSIRPFWSRQATL
jgi:hypothetical protein